MPCSRIVIAFLTAMIIVGYAHANAADPSPEVDSARQHERYAIRPGAEQLFADMLGRGETLPGGCTLTDGQIERTSVVATYSCGDARIVLQLAHRESAPPSAVQTQRFAVTVESGTPPAGLIEAVADRIRAREAGFEWAEVGNRTTPTTSRALPVAAGAVIATLAFWILRRRASNA